MRDRILNFSYESLTPNRIYEKVSATPKFLTDPSENLDTVEINALKHLIKEDGMPNPNIYRGTYLSYSNSLKPYPELPWFYYFKHNSHSKPVLINTHQARHILKHEEYGKEWLLEYPNETEVVLTITITEGEDEKNLYVYRTCTRHPKFFSKAPTYKTYTYYIVKEFIDEDGNICYSHPFFIKPAELEEMKADTTRFNEIVDTII